MARLKINAEHSQALSLVMVIGLGLAVFLYPLLKPIPPGVDSAVYLNDAHWIVDHQALPKTGHVTYHGSTAYPAPLTAVNVAIISQLTGWPLVFPTFSVYQMFLIFLLLISCALVGSIYSRMMAVLFPLAVIGSHALIRLFIGSTVANILAFAIINLLFYLVHDYVTNRRQASLALMPVALVGLYYAHSYLTAPLFIPFFLVYFILVVTTNAGLRQGFTTAIKRWPLWLKIGAPVAAVGLIVAVVVYYLPVFKEARYTFFLNQPTSKFAGIIPVKQYQAYLGNFIFIPGVLGFFLYALRPKKNLLSYRVLPWVWIVALLGLLQVYRLGISFFFERLVFLGSIFISFFAAYFMVWVFSQLNRSMAAVGIACFAILTATSGALHAKNLYDQSNHATSDQVEALTVLRNASNPTDQVYSHINGVSETYHDVIVSDRDIIYLTTRAANCLQGDGRCFAFTTPEAADSDDYFQSVGVKYFLFMKPSQEGNAVLDELIARYRADRRYRSLYFSKRAALFTLSNP